MLSLFEVCIFIINYQISSVFCLRNLHESKNLDIQEFLLILKIKIT